jgi:hypothetical protein
VQGGVDVSLLCVVGGHSDWVTCLDFQASRFWPLYLASGSADSNIRVWIIQSACAPPLERDTPRPTQASVPVAAADTAVLSTEFDSNSFTTGGGTGERLVRRPEEAVGQSVKRHVFTLGASKEVCVCNRALIGR